MFGPYRHGEIPDSDDARRYVAGIIRQVKWKASVALRLRHH